MVTLGGKTIFLSETRKNTRWLSKSDDVISVFGELNFDRYSPSFCIACNKNDMKYSRTRHFSPTKQVRDYLNDGKKKKMHILKILMNCTIILICSYLLKDIFINVLKQENLLNYISITTIKAFFQKIKNSSK